MGLYGIYPLVNCHITMEHHHVYGKTQYISSTLDFKLSFSIIIPVCTAQGGGGSFKDRKPIGAVRCCESWMAEQTH